MRRVAWLAAVLLAVTVADPVAATLAAAKGSGPGRACASLVSLSLPGGTVDSAAENATGTVSRPDYGTVTGLPAFCDVQLTVTGPRGDRAHVEVWLPARTWNGRFQGVGGSGYAARSGLPLAGPLKAGYAAADTDAGHTSTGAFNGAFDGSFALTAAGVPNWPSIIDFGSLAVHEMTVAGQAVTRAYYGSGPAFSYFTGCSTGGRQGLMEAQRYPHDYDGILAGAPAINWTRFVPAELWPQLVMLRSDDFLPQCKFDAANAAAVAACDGLDGVADGVIGNLTACRFDPATLVGTATPCGPITATDARVIAAIWEGPRSADGNFLWHGLEPGASFATIADTVTVNGETVGVPFPIVTEWFRYFLLRNPGWDWRTMSFAEFEQRFAQSSAEFGNALATDDPDLNAFHAAGGKIVVWHGLADELIFPQGTVDYYQRVRQAVGGRTNAETFARLFLAPGVIHCGGGAGPTPADPLAALVDWVEHQLPPRDLLAARTAADGTVTTRPVCMYPLVARYRGHGSVNDAASFVCRSRW